MAGAALALSGLLLTGTAALLWLNLSEISATRTLTTQTRAAQSLTGQWLLDLKDAEASQRGYLLTGNRADLAPFLDAKARLASQARAAAGSPLNADPAYAARIARLRQLTQAWLGELEHAATLRQTDRPQAAPDLLRADQDRRVMEMIEAEAAALRADIDARLRNHAAQEQRDVILSSAAAMGFAALAALLLGGLCIGRQRARARTAALTRAFSLAQGLVRDLDGRIVFWSDGAERLYGYTAAEAIGRRSHELLRTTFPRPLPELAAALLRDGQWQGELIDRRRDGTELAVASHWSLYHEPAFGKPLIIEVNSDISRIRRAETEVAAREAQLRSINDAIPGLVFAADTAARNTYTNQRFQDFTGMSSEALLGYGWKQVLHPNDAGRADALWDAAIRSGQNYEAEYRFRRADGTWHWFLVRAAPLRGPDGQIESWHGVCLDIDRIVHSREAQARQEAELARLVAQRTAALAASERGFRLLVNGVVDYAIIMLDREGRVTQWNAGAERHKGYRAEEIIGQPFARFFTEEDRAAGLPERILRTALREGHYEGANCHVRKDGSRFWGHETVDRILDESGMLVGFARITRDITAERKARQELEETQQRLAQAQKMEAVGQLTSGIAHDFNNLLQAVTGNLDLARSAVARGKPERINRLLDNAGRAIERGARLTGQLLTFSRRQTLRAERVLPSSLVADMGDLIRRAVGETIGVETTAEPGLWHATIDPAQFESAVLNLVINARDAMPRGGRLALRMTNVTLDAAASAELDVPPGAYVCLDVADTGTGMTPEVLARMFEPFFTTKEVGKGSGLGLAQVHGFVRQSGGAVRVRSTLDQGTVVSLLFPRDATAEELASPAGPKPEAEDETPPITVLLVEDEPAVFDVTQIALIDAGHQVVPARDGAEALELIRCGTPFDLLLSDVVLPGPLSGVDIARAVRKLRPGAPVLLASGYAADVLATHGATSEFEMLHKPYAQADLLRRIAALVRERERPTV